ncbi:MAG: response regulator [Burkholderiales bacterium]|nr:response regulator [Burkholderiales bacterium]MBH2014888.1 response regulator [Burkholderiales bacterium]
MKTRDIASAAAPPDAHEAPDTPEAPGHILVVDDDAQLVELLAEHLSREGFRVSGAGNAHEMRAVLARERIQLIVLDLMLPGENGLSICRALRAREAPALPILMLSARGDEADRVLGLEMGADDYLAKPMSPRELLARVRALLRRSRLMPVDTNLRAPVRQLHFGDWRLDTAARHLVDANGVTVPLTGGEHRLLQVLLSHPQRVLSRDQLLSLTQGRDAEGFDRSIDLLMSRLRKRLREDPKAPRYIRTVRNEGYQFCAAVRVVHTP